MADSNWLQIGKGNDPPCYYAQENNNPSPQYTPREAYADSTNSHVVYPEKFSKKAKFQDVWAIPLFFLHLAGFLYVSYLSIPAIGTPPIETTVRGLFRPIAVSAPLGIAFGISAMIGFLLSLGYFILIQKFALTAIKATFIASITFCFALAAYFFYLEVVWAVIVALVFAALYIICWFWLRSRIPFASIMLETVTGVTRKYKGMLGATILGSLLQIMVSIYVFLTIEGIVHMTHDNPADCNTTSHVDKYQKRTKSTTCPNDAKRTLLILFAVFSHYWVSQVIKTTIHVTVSGVFAAYYFLEGTMEGVPSWPTIGSAKRALTTSFGSICFGSLIVALFRTLKATLRIYVIETERTIFVYGMILCLLEWIDALVQYFNYYAYAQVAIYGKNYCTAAKDTWRLLQHHGVDAIIKDNVINTVLTMGEVLVGGLTAFLMFLALTIVDQQQEELGLICSFAFFIGFWMTAYVGEIIESGTATTFVALVEDPETLARTKPVLYELIRVALPNIVSGV